MSGRDDVLDVAADLAQLATVGRFVRERWGDRPQATLVELAVHELVLNAIQHGGARHCRIGVRLGALGGELEICDDGAPFDASRAPRQPLGELREGGYGLGIVHAVAERLSYAYRDGWNTLRISVSD